MTGATTKYPIGESNPIGNNQKWKPPKASGQKNPPKYTDEERKKNTKRTSWRRSGTKMNNNGGGERDTTESRTSTPERRFQDKTQHIFVLHNPSTGPPTQGLL